MKNACFLGGSFSFVFLLYTIQKCCFRFVSCISSFSSEMNQRHLRNKCWKDMRSIKYNFITQTPAGATSTKPPPLAALMLLPLLPLPPPPSPSPAASLRPPAAASRSARSS